MNAYGINAKNTGATLLGTTENGTQNFVPVFCILHCTGVSGLVTAASYSVGTNASSYNNFIAATATASIAGQNLIQNNPATAGAIVVPPNTPIYVNVPVAMVGTSMTFDIHLFGFYK